MTDLFAAADEDGDYENIYQVGLRFVSSHPLTIVLCVCLAASRDSRIPGGVALSVAGVLRSVFCAQARRRRCIAVVLATSSSPFCGEHLFRLFQSVYVALSSALIHV